jgi:hypothetical protein
MRGSKMWFSTTGPADLVGQLHPYPYPHPPTPYPLPLPLPRLPERVFGRPETVTMPSNPTPNPTPTPNP